MPGKPLSLVESYLIKHLKPFAYKKRHNARPSLQVRAYRARDLLNCTVASFYDISNEDLTSHQRRAKKEFIELFERQAKRPIAELHDTDLYSTLKTLKACLDEFFFFGSLTPFSQEFTLTHFPPGTRLHGLFNLTETEDKSFRFKITLDKRRDGKPAALPELVATLVHELTHAFLRVFACQCPRCLRNDFNGVGIKTTRHGPIFRGMHYAAMVSLASWSEELDRVFRIRSGGTYIQRSSLASEKISIEDVKKSGDSQKMHMLPYIRKPSSRLLIRVSEDSVVIDVDRLRANVKRTAASIRPAISFREKLSKILNLDSNSETPVEFKIDSAKDCSDADSDTSVPFSNGGSTADRSD
ncbi:hypothetical protein GQX73_g1180 [Xylaria multiplex]|uniref:SprT-like domain-containing protein n=1 Tax=Xylaria multiplex TaxID=323545 RepID=A0A7C8J2K3_9PEZI|nr:hypothetical protein GQX73_g1180 [Xylaria multiplex]